MAAATARCGTGRPAGELIPRLTQPVYLQLVRDFLHCVTTAGPAGPNARLRVTFLTKTDQQIQALFTAITYVETRCREGNRKKAAAWTLCRVCDVLLEGVPRMSARFAAALTAELTTGAVDEGAAMAIIARVHEDLVEDPEDTVELFFSWVRAISAASLYVWEKIRRLHEFGQHFDVCKQQEGLLAHAELDLRQGTMDVETANELVTVAFTAGKQFVTSANHYGQFCQTKPACWTEIMDSHPVRFNEAAHLLTAAKMQIVLQELQVQRRDLADPLLPLSVLRQDGTPDFLRDNLPISTNQNFCLAAGQEFLPGRGHCQTFDDLQTRVVKQVKDLMAAIERRKRDLRDTDTAFDDLLVSAFKKEMRRVASQMTTDEDGVPISAVDTMPEGLVEVLIEDLKTLKIKCYDLSTRAKPTTVEGMDGMSHFGSDPEGSIIIQRWREELTVRKLEIKREYDKERNTDKKQQDLIQKGLSTIKLIKLTGAENFLAWSQDLDALLHLVPHGRQRLQLVKDSLDNKQDQEKMVNVTSYRELTSYLRERYSGDPECVDSMIRKVTDLNEPYSIAASLDNIHECNRVLFILEKYNLESRITLEVLGDFERVSFQKQTRTEYLKKRSEWKRGGVTSSTLYPSPPGEISGLGLTRFATPALLPEGDEDSVNFGDDIKALQRSVDITALLGFYVEFCKNHILVLREIQAEEQKLRRRGRSTTAGRGSPFNAAASSTRPGAVRRTGAAAGAARGRGRGAAAAAGRRRLQPCPLACVDTNTGKIHEVSFGRASECVKFSGITDYKTRKNLARDLGLCFKCLAATDHSVAPVAAGRIPAAASACPNSNCPALLANGEKCGKPHHFLLHPPASAARRLGAGGGDGDDDEDDDAEEDDDLDEEPDGQDQYDGRYDDVEEDEAEEEQREQPDDQEEEAVELGVRRLHRALQQPQDTDLQPSVLQLHRVLATTRNKHKSDKVAQKFSALPQMSLRLVTCAAQAGSASTVRQISNAELAKHLHSAVLEGAVARAVPPEQLDCKLLHHRPGSSSFSHSSPGPDSLFCAALERGGCGGTVLTATSDRPPPEPPPPATTTRNLPPAMSANGNLSGFDLIKIRKDSHPILHNQILQDGLQIANKFPEVRSALVSSWIIVSPDQGSRLQAAGYTLRRVDHQLQVRTTTCLDLGAEFSGVSKHFSEVANLTSQQSIEMNLLTVQQTETVTLSCYHCKFVDRDGEEILVELKQLESIGRDKLPAKDFVDYVVERFNLRQEEFHTGSQEIDFLIGLDQCSLLGCPATLSPGFHNFPPESPNLQIYSSMLSSKLLIIGRPGLEQLSENQNFAFNIKKDSEYASPATLVSAAGGVARRTVIQCGVAPEYRALHLLLGERVQRREQRDHLRVLRRLAQTTTVPHCLRRSISAADAEKIEKWIERELSGFLPPPPCPQHDGTQCRKCRKLRRPQSAEELDQLKKVQSSLTVKQLPSETFLMPDGTERKEERFQFHFSMIEAMSEDWKHVYQPKHSNKREAERDADRMREKCIKKGQLQAYKDEINKMVERGCFEAIDPKMLEHQPHHFIYQNMTLKESSTTTRVRQLLDTSRKFFGASLAERQLKGLPALTMNTPSACTLGFRARECVAIFDISACYNSYQVCHQSSLLRCLTFFDNEGKRNYFRTKTLSFGDNGSAQAVELGNNVHVATSKHITMLSAQEAITEHRLVDDGSVTEEDVFLLEKSKEEIRRAYRQFNMKIKHLLSPKRFQQADHCADKCTSPNTEQIFGIIWFFNENPDLMYPAFQLATSPLKKGQRNGPLLQDISVHSIVITKRLVMRLAHQLYDNNGAMLGVAQAHAKYMLALVCSRYKGNLDTDIKQVDAEVYNTLVNWMLNLQQLVQELQPMLRRIIPTGYRMVGIILKVDGGECGSGSVAWSISRLKDSLAGRSDLPRYDCSIIGARTKATRMSCAVAELQALQLSSKHLLDIIGEVPHFRRSLQFVAVHSDNMCAAGRFSPSYSSSSAIVSNTTSLARSLWQSASLQMPDCTIRVGWARGGSHNSADPLTKVKTVNPVKILNSQRWRKGTDEMLSEENLEQNVFLKYKNGEEDYFRLDETKLIGAAKLSGFLKQQKAEQCQVQLAEDLECKGELDTAEQEQFEQVLLDNNHIVDGYERTLRRLSFTSAVDAEGSRARGGHCGNCRDNIRLCGSSRHPAGGEAAVRLTRSQTRRQEQLEQQPPPPLCHDIRQGPPRSDVLATQYADNVFAYKPAQQLKDEQLVQCDSCKGKGQCVDCERDYTARLGSFTTYRQLVGALSCPLFWLLRIRDRGTTAPAQLWLTAQRSAHLRIVKSSQRLFPPNIKSHQTILREDVICVQFRISEHLAVMLYSTPVLPLISHRDVKLSNALMMNAHQPPTDHNGRKVCKPVKSAKLEVMLGNYGCFVTRSDLVLQRCEGACDQCNYKRELHYTPQMGDNMKLRLWEKYLNDGTAPQPFQHIAIDFLSYITAPPQTGMTAQLIYYPIICYDTIYRCVTVIFADSYSSRSVVLALNTLQAQHSKILSISVDQGSQLSENCLRILCQDGGRLLAGVEIKRVQTGHQFRQESERVTQEMKRLIKTYARVPDKTPKRKLSLLEQQYKYSLICSEINKIPLGTSAGNDDGFLTPEMFLKPCLRGQPSSDLTVPLTESSNDYLNDALQAIKCSQQEFQKLMINKLQSNFKSYAVAAFKNRRNKLQITPRRGDVCFIKQDKFGPTQYAVVVNEELNDNCDIEVRLRLNDVLQKRMMSPALLCPIVRPEVSNAV